MYLFCLHSIEDSFRALSWSYYFRCTSRILTLPFFYFSRYPPDYSKREGGGGYHREGYKPHGYHRGGGGEWGARPHHPKHPSYGPPVGYGPSYYAPRPAGPGMYGGPPQGSQMPHRPAPFGAHRPDWGQKERVDRPDRPDRPQQEWGKDRPERPPAYQKDFP